MLVTGASLSVVEMVVYDVFGVADSYTKSPTDTRYPFKGNNSIIRLNGQTISADITIDSDENGVSAGSYAECHRPQWMLEHRMTSVLNVTRLLTRRVRGHCADEAARCEGLAKS